MLSVGGLAFSKGEGLKWGMVLESVIGVNGIIGLGVGPLLVLFSRLFRLASNKESSVKDYCVRGGGLLSWEVSFCQGLCQSEESQSESIKSDACGDDFSIFVWNVSLCLGYFHCFDHGH